MIRLFQKNVILLHFIWKKIVVLRFNLPGSAKNYSGHLGMIMMRNCFLFFKLQERDMKITLLLERLEIHPLISETTMGFFKRFEQMLILKIQP